MTRKEVIETLNAVKYLGFSEWDNDGVGGLFIGRKGRDYKKLFEDDAIRIAKEQKAIKAATDDQIADRIVIVVDKALAHVEDPTYKAIEASDLLDAAEAYRMAFAKDATEWMEMRREGSPVRKIVFKKMGLNDYSCVEK